MLAAGGRWYNGNRLMLAAVGKAGRLTVMKLPIGCYFAGFGEPRYTQKPADVDDARPRRAQVYKEAG